MISARFSNRVSHWRRLVLVVMLLILTIASFAAEERKIESLDFVDTDVTLVLKSLADISGANIVISPQVQGKITLKLSDVSLKEALDYITKVNGLSYRVDNESYVVGPREIIEKGYEGEKDHLTATLKVLSPAEATTTLGNVYKDVTVNALPGGRLVLSGKKERIAAAKAFLDTIDVVMPETTKPEIIESSYTVRVAVPWQTKKYLEDQYASRGLSISYAPNRQVAGAAPATTSGVWESDTLILRGPQGIVNQALATLAKIDAAPPAVRKRARTERIFATQAITYLLDRYENRGLSIVTAPLTNAAVVQKTGVDDNANASKSGTVGIVVRRDATGKLNIMEPIGDFFLEGPDAIVQEALQALATIDVGPERVERIYSVKFLKSDEAKKQLDEIYGKQGLLVSLGPARKGSTPNMASGSSDSGSSSSTPTSTSGAEAAITDLVLRGPEDVVGRAIQLITTLDTEPAQVLINTKIVSINADDAKTLGVTWSGAADGKITPGSVGIGLKEQASGDIFSWGKVLRTNVELNARIDALETKHRAKTISQPHTVVQNGKEANIHVGQQIFYEKVTGLNSNGSPIFSTEQISAGVTLNVKPLVSSNGIITLEITTNVTDKPVLVPSSNGGTLPTFNENQSATIVHMRDGETLIIGGLTQSVSDVAETGIPVLSKLPLLGPLFKSKSSKPSQTELMILVTPRLLLPGGQAAAPAAGVTP